MYGQTMSTVAARAAAMPTPAAAGKDYSSCWSALPTGIRQRLEPMLTDSNGGRHAARTTQGSVR